MVGLFHGNRCREGGVLLGRDEQLGTGQEGVYSEHHVQLIGGQGEQDEE